MKITENDKKFLTQSLNKELTYRETYEEMLDHILTALENYPEGETFELALRNVLQTQFGGMHGLQRMEREYRRQAVYEMRNRYLIHISRLFKFPSVVLLLLVTASAYVLFSWLSFNKSLYMVAFFAVAAIPSLLNGIRYFRTGYLLGNVKRSVSDDGFRLLKYAPGVLFACFVFYHTMVVNDTPAIWFKSIAPATATAVFMVLLSHTMAYFKMYKDAFKFKVAA